MEGRSHSFRLLAGCLLGSLVALAIFGLIVGSFFTIIGRQDIRLLWTVFLLSAALAFAAGGFASAWVSRPRSILGGALFGLLFGTVSVGYIAPTPRQFVYVLPVCVLVGMLGAWLFNRLTGEDN